MHSVMIYRTWLLQRCWLDLRKTRDLGILSKWLSPKYWSVTTWGRVCGKSSGWSFYGAQNMLVSRIHQWKQSSNTSSILFFASWLSEPICIFIHQLSLMPCPTDRGPAALLGSEAIDTELCGRPLAGSQPGPIKAWANCLSLWAVPGSAALYNQFSRATNNNWLQTYSIQCSNGYPTGLCCSAEQVEKEIWPV